MCLLANVKSHDSIHDGSIRWSERTQDISVWYFGAKILKRVTDDEALIKLWLDL